MSVSRLEPSDSVVVAVTTFQIISNRPCAVQGLSLAPAAVSCTVTLYDPVGLNLNQTPVVADLASYTRRVVVAAGADGHTASHPCDASGINFQAGCIAVVSGTGALATVTYGKF